MTKSIVILSALVSKSVFSIRRGPYLALIVNVGAFLIVTVRRREQRGLEREGVILTFFLSTGSPSAAGTFHSLSAIR